MSKSTKTEKTPAELPPEAPAPPPTAEDGLPTKARLRWGESKPRWQVSSRNG